MKKTQLLVSLLLPFMLSSSATALFAASYSMKGTLTEQTKAFFIGKTRIEGSFTGIPMNYFINSSLVENMGGFPLLGSGTISDLDSVIVAENVDISTASSFEDLVARYLNNLTYYIDVDITTEKGVFVLGISQGTLNLAADLPYAVSTFLPYNLIPDSKTRFFCIGTYKPLIMDCTGDYAVLSSISDTSTVQVRERNGRILWTGDSSNDYLIIQDPQFSVALNSSLSLVPLNDSLSETSLTVSVSPADPEDIAIHQLIENTSNIVGETHDDASEEFLKTLHDFNDIVQTTTFVTNGAMVFLQTNDSVTIDHSVQHFSSTGFVRFTSLEITNVGSSFGPAIQADCILCYLGDHFYNPSAKRSADGIMFPFELIIIWCLAVSAFIYIRFFVRPPVDIILDKSVKRYALIIHLIGLILAFLLLDLEVNLLFGISATTALITQGVSMITGVFFLFEIVLWIAGFIILGVPMQLLSYAILRFLGIGKGGNGLWKAIGDLSIWVFSTIYLLLFFNVLFVLIDFQRFFPMG